MRPIAARYPTAPDHGKTHQRHALRDRRTVTTRSSRATPVAMPLVARTFATHYPDRGCYYTVDGRNWKKHDAADGRVLQEGVE